MIRPYGQPEDDENERDPYAGLSDSNGIAAETPPESTTPATDKAPEVKPYTPPPETITSSVPKANEEQPTTPTFREMEAAGQARPPMPLPHQASDWAGVSGPDSPVPELPTPIRSSVPVGDDRNSGLSVPPVTGDNLNSGLSVGPMVAGDNRNTGLSVPPPIAPWEGTAPVLTAGDDTRSTGMNVPPPTPVDPRNSGLSVPPQDMATGDGLPTSAAAPLFTSTVAAPTAAPASDAILKLMTGGAEGSQSPLAQATEAKALERLNSASPYDSKAVRDEYDWLGGSIDDQFAMDQRATDEGMAARGLYGSAGKDFHSGRLSDLNVGKRTAKQGLAQDLANKYATTKGQYDANAVSQAQSVAGQGDAGQRAWLQSLMGYGNDQFSKEMAGAEFGQRQTEGDRNYLRSYGNDAFANDLASAEFGQRQNESEQDFLMQMLRMGYGV